MRKATVRKSRESGVTVKLSGTEITPVAQRTFARYYEVERLGVSVAIEEGTTYCTHAHDHERRCAWCTTHDKDNHAEVAPGFPILCLTVEGAGGEITGTITAAQLGAMIEALTIVRDKMVADGALVAH